MAAFDTSRPTYAVGQTGLGGIFTNLFAAVAAWNDKRLTRNALRDLTDRELDDIGLVRGDIDTL